MNEPTEIKELDMNKCLVLKWDEIEHLLPPLDIKYLHKIDTAIINYKSKINKPTLKYLVLNLDDEIDWDYLENNLLLGDKIYVRDVALALVNAIQKAKEKP